MPSHPAAGGRRLRLLTPVRMFAIGVCVLVLVAATAGLTGGLDEVAVTDDVPPGEVRQFIEGEPWNVSVYGAGLFIEASPAVLTDENNHWLMVIADIEITADESTARLAEVLAVSGIDGLGEPDPVIGTPRPDRIYLGRDATSRPVLHPGLPEQVVFLWERSGDEPAPDEITVHVIGMTLRESSLFGHEEWHDHEPVARVTVPLTDRREDQREELAEADEQDGPADPPVGEP